MRSLLPIATLLTLLVHAALLTPDLPGGLSDFSAPTYADTEANAPFEEISDSDDSEPDPTLVGVASGLAGGSARLLPLQFLEASHGVLPQSPDPRPPRS